MDDMIASVQYNDLTGTAAADDADFRNLRKQLLENGHIAETEYVVGFSFYYTSISTSVRVLVAHHDDLGSLSAEDPHSLRTVNLQTTLIEFFSLYKRFSIKLLDQHRHEALDRLDIDAIPSSDDSDCLE